MQLICRFYMKVDNLVWEPRAGMHQWIMRTFHFQIRPQPCRVNIFIISLFILLLSMRKAINLASKTRLRNHRYGRNNAMCQLQAGGIGYLCHLMRMEPARLALCAYNCRTGYRDWERPHSRWSTVLRLWFTSATCLTLECKLQLPTTLHD